MFSYIRLEEKYIAGGTDGNFAKRSDLEADGMGLLKFHFHCWTSQFIALGLPYDLGSVMHYGPNVNIIDNYSSS